MTPADFESLLAWMSAHPGFVSAPLTLAARVPVFAAGQPCPGFPVVLDGEVQVYRESAQGKRLELYRVCAGEICLVSTASLFCQAPLTASAMTTQPCVVRMISPDGFFRLADEQGPRGFLFAQFAQRLTDLMEAAEAVAFQRLDKRLASALLGRGPMLAVSHQDLAHALGTSREIVTRLLRRFEEAGWVELGRNAIHVRDARALRDFCSEPT